MGNGSLSLFFNESTPRGLKVVNMSAVTTGDQRLKTATFPLGARAVLNASEGYGTDLSIRGTSPASTPQDVVVSLVRVIKGW